MDKHSPRISIKVNGAQTKYVVKNTSLEQQTEEEIEALLPVIEAPANLIPFRDEYEVNVPEKRNGSVGKRIAVSIGTAVVLGTGFGVSVLHMLSGNEQRVQGVAPAVVAPVEPTQPDEAQDKDTSVVELVTLQSISVYVMQAGVFSTKDNGRAVLADLKKKGIPASLHTAKGKFYLFTVVAKDEQTTKAIGESYKIQGVSPYFKAWKIEETQVPTAYKKYGGAISQTVGLLTALLQQSSLYFDTGKIDEKEWERMDNEVQALAKDGKSIEEEKVKKLLTYAFLAYDALNDYKKEPNKETLVKLQQLLLDGLVSYETLVTSG